MISIPDTAASREKWKETAMGKAWADPAVAYWKAMELDPAVEKVLERMGAAEILPIFDLVSGQAVFALELLPPSNEKQDAGAGMCPRPVFHAALSFGERVQEARAFIEENWPHLKDETPARTSLPPIVLHGPLQSNGTTLCSAWLRDTFLISSSLEGLRETLNRRMGRMAGSQKNASLAQTPAWKKTAKHLNRKDDATIFFHGARVYDDVFRAIQNAPNASGWRQIGGACIALSKIADLDAIETIAANLEMRGAGFYQSSVITLRKETEGILLPPADARPLKTPEWAMRDIESFSASRMCAPLQIKRMIQNFLNTLDFPPSDFQGIEHLIKERTGYSSDQILAALGTETAMLSRESRPIPDLAFLWESANPELLRSALNNLVKSMGGSSQTESFMGYRYQIHLFPLLPLGICTAEIDGFFMVSTQTRWLRSVLEQKDRLVSAGAIIQPEAPMGEASLLPDLEKPFGKIPKDYWVSGRTFSNPAPGLREIAAYLPIVLPLANLQLQSRGLPRIPAWVRSALPPLLPFAREVFPTVTRTVRREDRIVSESFSAFDPMVSPFAAAGFVMAVRYWEESRPQSATSR